MRHGRIGAALLLLWPGLAGAQAAEQTLKAGDLTIKVPADWEAVPDDRVLLALLTPIEGEKDTFRENLRIGATDVEKGTTIDALMKASLAPIEKGETPLKLAGKGALTANGHKVMWLALRPKQPKPDQEPMTLVEYGFVHAGKAYAFKAMAADAKVEKFKVAVEKILKTLEPKAGK